MIPTTNVNLHSCNCIAPAVNAGIRGLPVSPLRCQPGCASLPVLIPCPIPRSATFSVARGECDCPHPLGHGAYGHAPNCSARPIRVTCSIGGKTWPDSLVEFVERADGECIGAAFDRVDTVCRERWKIVTALVTGEGANGRWNPGGLMGWAVWDRPGDLFAQRDAVYAALADMARMERAYYSAAEAIHAAVPGIYISSDMQVCAPDDAPSGRWLAAYVEHLIKQVGLL